MQIANPEQSSGSRTKWSSSFGFAAAHALTASVTYWVLLPLFMHNRIRTDQNLVSRAISLTAPVVFIVALIVHRIWVRDGMDTVRLSKRWPQALILESYAVGLLAIILK